MNGLPKMFMFQNEQSGRMCSPQIIPRQIPANISLTLFVLSLILSPIGLRADPGTFDATQETVGHQTNGLVTPVNQLVTPTGIQVELPGMRPQALAISPDGQLLVTAGLSHELMVLNPKTGTILQRVPFPSGKTETAVPVSEAILNPDNGAQLSYTGLTFSPDGSRIYMANVNGDIKVFGVQPDRQVAPLFSIPLPPANAPGREAEIPAGIAVSPDGKRLYVALNLSNHLIELDAVTGQSLRLWNVGVAPFDVLLAGHKIYVSNWGGRRPDMNSVTGPAGRGTIVRVDSVRYIASEGSVSVIDLESTNQLEVLTGLHACALALSPDARHLVVANAGSDTLSVIDTRTDKVVDTLFARQHPGDLFGAQPNALTFDKVGRRLFVCNGTQNAVAVFQFKSESRLLGLIPVHHFKPGKTQLLGLIPVGWFPGAIVYDASRKMLYVANIKDISPGREDKSAGTRKFNTKEYYGSLSLVPVPSKHELAKFTQTTLRNLRYPLLTQAALPPRTNEPPRPVPERTGEPSVFKHVIYILKENRSYDQVLGDMTTGNGDPTLCIFGDHVTPNQHKLARDFVLLDNTYCAGILSADGHEWADSAMATDYMERSFAGFPRSYPAGAGENEVDALAYSPAGFIWDNAIAHGKTLRDYGEFTLAHWRWKTPRKTKPRFLDYYHQFVEGTDSLELWSEPHIESLRPYVATNTIGWNLDVPDLFRARQFIADLKRFEQADNLPDFMILWLPNDHTSGTRPDSPTPAAQVADNDLAFGQVVEAVSHSRFWTNTCIFAVEDDPQDGWDHVSGYRTTAYVASAYTKRGQTISTQYNQTGLLRTIELILGLPPMNQMDATATPMFDCFTSTPDFTSFNAVSNQIPLDQMNPASKTISDAILRKDANVSTSLPLEKPDECPDDTLNRILWHAAKGSQSPYPQWAIHVVGDND
jgi:YVTN family beta-propeller protein